MISPRHGQSGASVKDLHRRLTEAGHPVVQTEVVDEEFGADTTRALLAFQAERGLDEHGLLDETTNAALIEAGLRLGDRHLYLHSPMFRGDDVADLQLNLGSLGFDAGRIDGIFGPDTANAVEDFQKNIALPVDGIAGPHTIRSLRHLLGRTAGRRPVAQVRELDQLRRRNPEFRQKRLAIGHFGGAATLTTALSRVLRAGGAQVLELDHPDEATQAETANKFDAELYLGLRLENDSYSRFSYFGTDGFHSEGGLRLAHHCANALDHSLRPFRSTQNESDNPSTVCEKRRLPVLRRTRMPAVLCTLAPPSMIVLATAEVATSLATAISMWVADPAADLPS